MPSLSNSEAQWVRPWTIREIGQVINFDLKATLAFLDVYRILYCIVLYKGGWSKFIEKNKNPHS